MLAYVLALIVGLGSFALYMAAFFFPEIHRKNDLLWSGVGLFYALVLWVCAGRITGGVLLGQLAGVALLGWLGWQTVHLRRQAAPLDQQTALPTREDLQVGWDYVASSEGRSQLVSQIAKTVGQVKEGVVGAISGANRASQPVSRSTEDTYVPPKLEEFGTAGQEAIARLSETPPPEQPASAPERIRDRQEALQETAAAGLEAGASASAPLFEPASELPHLLDTIAPDAIADLVTEQTTAAQRNVRKTAKNVTRQASATADAARDAAVTAKRTVSQTTRSVSKKSAPAIATVPQRITNGIKALADTVQSFVSGLTQKPEQKTVYVRKQFRDTPVENATPDLDADLDIFEAAFAELEEPVDQAKGAIAEATAMVESLKDGPRDQPQEAIAAATEVAAALKAELTEQATDLLSATHSMLETVAGETVKNPVENLSNPVENVSEAIASDLLGNPPPEATAEEIVEDLLEEISAQEDAAEREPLEAIPPHPPSEAMIEAAIADAEAKGLPVSPPTIANPGDEPSSQS